MTTNLLPIMPAPPCAGCAGVCCRTTQPHVVELHPDELWRFPEAQWFSDGVNPDRKVPGLPAVDGRCLHLTDEGRCGIYDRRPRLCRTYSCLPHYRAYRVLGIPSFLLQDYPELIELIERSLPEWAANFDGLAMKEPANGQGHS